MVKKSGVKKGGYQDRQERKIKAPIQKAKKPTPPTPAIPEENISEKKSEVGSFKKYLNVFHFDTILPGSGKKIKFKPLTVAHLKSLLTVDGLDEKDPNKIEPDKLTEIFDDIIRKAIINENFDIDELYIQDRFHLLLEIRKKTKGESEQYKIKCPKCKSESIQKIDFDKVENKPKKEKINPIVKLTDDLSVNMRFIKRKHEREAYDVWRNTIDDSLKPIEKNAEASIYLEAQAIDYVITPEGNENVTIFDKKYLLENIPQPLYKKLTDWSDENEFGPIMKMKIKCPHCKFESEQDIGSSDFFI